MNEWRNEKWNLTNHQCEHRLRCHQNFRKEVTISTHSCQLFGVEDQSSASSNILEQSNRYPSLRKNITDASQGGWHRAHWTSNSPDDRSFTWRSWMKVWGHIVINLRLLRQHQPLACLNCIVRSKLRWHGREARKRKAKGATVGKELHWRLAKDKSKIV